jgi:hypothetical protein
VTSSIFSTASTLQSKIRGVFKPLFKVLARRVLNSKVIAELIKDKIFLSFIRSIFEDSKNDNSSDVV